MRQIMGNHFGQNSLVSWPVGRFWAGFIFAAARICLLQKQLLLDSVAQLVVAST